MSGLGRVLGPCALLYGFEHHRAQQEHADEVGESHQRVEGVGWARAPMGTTMV